MSLLLYNIGLLVDNVRDGRNTTLNIVVNREREQPLTSLLVVHFRKGQLALRRIVEGGLVVKLYRTL